LRLLYGTWQHARSRSGGPHGLTYGEIDARQADSVRRANEALTALQHLGARWGGYHVSHDTFDLVVGDPLGQEDNVVICCTGIVHVSGPVQWPNQRLRVVFDCDRNSPEVWWFKLTDDAVGFRLETGGFMWQRKYDIHTNGSIWFSARAPAQKHLEYVCPQCKHPSYGYHPFCANCGQKLPTEAMMYGIGLTRPVSTPSGILQIGYEALRAEAKSVARTDRTNE
jgi:hypothetical protein